MQELDIGKTLWTSQRRFGYLASIGLPFDALTLAQGGPITNHFSSITQRISNKVRSYNWRLYNLQKETIDTSASTRAELPVTVGLMPEPKIRLQVNVAVATEAEGRRVGEDFQVAVCTDVVEQAF